MSINVEGRIMALPLHASNNNNASTRGGDRFGSVKQMNVAAAKELEVMKLRETTSEQQHPRHHRHQRFPPTCLQMLRNLPGNQTCVDCGKRQPEWASISYGSLLCISCAGRHRALGVNTSKVRSVSMDSWTHADVVAMLEGGNDQLASFYTRHCLCRQSYQHARRENSLLSPSASFSSTSSGSSEEDEGVHEEDITIKRYRTKAGLFYRKNLGLHVQRILSLGDGVYKGRDAYRGNACKQV